MIAYSTPWLEALQVRRQAARWHRKNLIGTAQYEAILAAYPVGFYTPNVFVRIGLALFCWILTLAAFGLFALIFMEGSSGTASVMLLLFGGGLFAALEYTIHTKHHYRSGIDDALLYSALGSVMSGFATLVPGLEDDFLGLSVLGLSVLTFGAVRYADKLVTGFAFHCALAVVFLTVAKIGPVGEAVLPFVLMAFSGIGYALLRRLRGQAGLRPWEACLRVLEVLCLVSFYLGGNYFVISEVSEAWFGAGAVPLAIIFYAFTALVPVLYIVFGLRQRDRVLLQAGMALLVLSALTFRYYFSLGHPEILVTVAGAALVVFAYVVIQLLKRGNLPFTYTREAEEPEEEQELESLVVNEALSRSVQGQPSAEPNPFGGGQFGGGGSSGNY
ncbi:MAG TPA: hypothetical protein VF646_13725 [Cytophagales bacterium]|jgi:hypothetical protein